MDRLESVRRRSADAVEIFAALSPDDLYDLTEAQVRDRSIS